MARAPTLILALAVVCGTLLHQWAEAQTSRILFVLLRDSRMRALPVSMPPRSL